MPFTAITSLNSVLGLDPFKPGYACGPEAVEKPVCTQFEDVKPSQLAGAFSTAGVPAVASGLVVVVPVGGSGGGSAQRLQLGDLATGHGQGVVTFTFDPPADAVWVNGDAQEAGSVTSSREGVVTARVPLDRKPRRYQFSGGIDQIEVWGSLAVIYEICFLPGWTCAHFESQAFPQGSIGEAEYAGLTLVSDGTMTVDGDFLKVEAPTQTQPGTMIEDPRSPHAHTNIRGSIRRRASTNTQPLRAEFQGALPGGQRRADDPTTNSRSSRAGYHRYTCNWRRGSWFRGCPKRPDSAALLQE